MLISSVCVCVCLIHQLAGPRRSEGFQEHRIISRITLNFHCMTKRGKAAAKLRWKASLLESGCSTARPLQQACGSSLSQMNKLAAIQNADASGMM